MLRAGNIAERPWHFRPVDFEKRSGRNDLFLRDDGYAGQLLHQGNRSVIIATQTPPRTLGIAQHRHPVDQIFVVVEGELVVKSQGEDHKVAAGGAILIPAGVAHETRNDGAVPNFYLEVLTPAPTFFSGIVLKENDPFQAAEGARAFVVPPGELGPTPHYERKEPGEAMRYHLLMTPAKGCKNAMIYQGENAVGGAAMQLHMHYTLDQFFFVTHGGLTVQIGLEKHQVKPRTLVIIPAGVPHTQWNEGQTPERHLAILTPPPPPGDRGDMWVALEQLPGDTRRE